MKPTMLYKHFMCLTFLISALSIDIHAQCEFEGIVFINELGNPSVNYDGSAEFIELVVVGDPSSPLSPVNLEGWIIDDNNSPAAGTGSEPGHIRLGPCFNQLTPGTIILIYDSYGIPPPRDSIPVPEIDTTLNGNTLGLFQISIEDPCIIKMDECPNHEEYGDYCDNAMSNEAIDTMSLWQKRNLWRRFVPMRNLGDAIQVRNPENELVHAINWVGIDFSGNAEVTIDMDSIGFDMSYQFYKNTHWLDTTAYRMVDDGEGYSPGQPNSPENAAFIESIRSGTSVFSKDVALFSDNVSGPGAQDGVLHLDIKGGILPMTATLMAGPANGSMPINSYGMHDFTGLPSGAYVVQVEDGDGCKKDFDMLVKGGNILCDITSIIATNLSSCDDGGTFDWLDDTFTADVTVTFDNIPSTGNLKISGTSLVGTDSILVSSIGAADTSYTFTNVLMIAKTSNATNINIIASFTADPFCTLRNPNAGVVYNSAGVAISVQGPRQCSVCPGSGGTVGATYPSCWPPQNPMDPCDNSVNYAPDAIYPEFTPIRYIKTVLHFFPKRRYSSSGRICG